MDCVVHGFTKSRTPLSNFHFPGRFHCEEATKPSGPRVHAVQQATTVRNLLKPQLESGGPHLLQLEKDCTQLEKAHTQQQRPTAKKYK